jgi:hypothetical protein
VALDLGEVTLLDRAAVRFLAGQLRRGVELMNCPVYLKHWISREAGRAFDAVHNILLLALAGLALLSSACMIGPKYQRPIAPAPAAYKEPPPYGWKEAQPNDGAIRGKWWYGDRGSAPGEGGRPNQNVLAAACFRSGRQRCGFGAVCSQRDDLPIRHRFNALNFAVVVAQFAGAVRAALGFTLSADGSKHLAVLQNSLTAGPHRLEIAIRSLPGEDGRLGRV